MRLVYRDERELQPGQLRQRPRPQKALWRDVEQVEPPGFEFTRDAPGIVRIDFRVQCPRRDAELAQCRNLVVHQGDKRRDDDRGAGPAEGRYLVAEALAAACRHQDKSVAAHDDVVDGGALQPPELREAEDPAQHLDRGRAVLDAGDALPDGKIRGQRC